MPSLLYRRDDHAYLLICIILTAGTIFTALEVILEQKGKKNDQV